MSVDKETKLRQITPVRSFEYCPEDKPEGFEPFRVEVVTPPAGKMVDIADAVVKIVAGYYIEGKTVSELAQIAMKDVLACLRPVVRVPGFAEGDNKIEIDELPHDVIPECLTLFLRSFSPGKWRALGTEVEGRFGIKLAAAAEEAKRAAATEVPKESSVPSESSSGV